MVKVVIANCYNDNNRGSAALNIAAVEHLKSAIGDPEIALLPLDHDATDDPKHDFRHTMATFPEVTVLPPLFSMQGRHDALRTFAAATGRFGSRGLNPRAVAALTQSAMVLSRGGVILHVREENVGGLASFVTRTHAFGVARRSGIPVVLYGAQIGPFPSRFRRIARTVLAPTVVALPRDRISARTAREMLPCARVETIPDTCLRLLAIPGVPGVGTTAPSGPGADVAIVVSKSTHVEAPVFWEALRSLLEEWLPRHPGAQVRFVTHVNGHRTSDARATEQAAAFLRSRLTDVKVSIVADDLHPLQLIEVYRSCGLVLASRLHAVLLALAAGTPAVSLATGLTFKEGAVLSELELPELAPGSPDAARRLVAAIATDPATWRRTIAEAVTAACARLEAVGPLLRDIATGHTV